MSAIRSNPGAALPFWIGMTLIPVAVIGAAWGGWWLLLMPAWALAGSTLLDRILGQNEANPDPIADDGQLFWYRLVTLVWFPLTFVLVFGTIWWVGASDHLNWAERLGVFFGVGIVTGGIGIVFAHELMHQKNRTERWLGDLLMGLVLYGHFRTEHLLVHHPWVGTPRDAVTARYNEGFHRFFPRILVECLASAWAAERAMLARRKLPVWHRTNPFWRYGVIAIGFLALAGWIGGLAGVGYFVFQAFIAVWYLELVNYVEHYGLVRMHTGGGKYEPVRPHHSWNAAHTATNWMLINLQRHSDHHYKPDRRFPLLQTYPADKAPQLPLGYPAMTALAMVPPLWRRVMNPRVRHWRKDFYPEVDDWSAYKSMSTPMPRSAS